MGLLKGDKIKSGSEDGYTLAIPSYKNPEIQKIYEEAKTYAGNSTGRRRVGKFVEYVHDAITWTDDWNEDKQHPSLTEAVKKRQGVCKEKAAVLGMILSREAISSEYKRGTYQNRGKHAWLKVDIEGNKYLADPTLKLLGKYDSVSKIRGFVEGKNKLEHE